MLTAQPAVGLDLALQRGLLLVGAAVLVLGGRVMVVVAVGRGHSAPEVLSIGVVVVPQVVLEVPAGCAVLLVEDDRLLLGLFYLVTLVFLKLSQRKLLKRVEKAVLVGVRVDFAVTFGRPLLRLLARLLVLESCSGELKCLGRKHFVLGLFVAPR